MEVGTAIMSNFTFVLGFLIVFRVNHAYSRWWEGGTLLQKIRGDWFNAYSSLLAFCNEATDKSVEVEHFKHTLARLMSLLYGNAIHLVCTADARVFECIDIHGLSPEHVEFMMKAPNRCEVILQWIQKLIVEGNERTLIKIAPPILSRVYNQLGDGIVDLNNAVKIAEFPIPFPLAQMVTIMLLYHVFLTCTVCAYSIQTGFWAAMFSFIIVFSFQSINYIACELEGPFGDDANDLPLALMASDMNTSLITLLADRAMTVPPTFEFGDMQRDLTAKSIDFDSELTAMASGSLKDRPGRDCKSKFRFGQADSESSEAVSPEVAASKEKEDAEKLTQPIKPNKPLQSQVQRDSRASGQAAASQSASQGQGTNASLPSLKTGSSEKQQAASALPAGTQSGGRQGRPLPESSAAATNLPVREREQSTEPKPVTTQIGRKDPAASSAAASSLSSSGPPLSKPISASDAMLGASKKVADKPAESVEKSAAALPKAGAPANMAFQPAASQQVSGEAENNPAKLVTTESVEREERNEVRLTVEPQSSAKPASLNQSTGKQSKQFQDLLPAAGSTGKESVRLLGAGMLAPTAAPGAGRDYGQVAAGLSAADEGAGGEREQRIALLPKSSFASDYLSDWL